MTAITRQLHGLLLLFLMCGGGCTDGDAVKTPDYQVTDSRTARAAFVDHLSKHGTEIGTKTPSDYDIKVKPFGESTWLVDAAFKGETPTSRATYIVDQKNVHEATLRNLVYAHASKFPASSDEKKHREIIESIVEIHSSHGHGHPATLISSTKDIPGYEGVKKGIQGNRIGGPLDADLQSVVRPSWKEEWPTSGYLFYVVYTYNRLGGVVSRYKFQFNATSRDENEKFHQWRIYAVDHIILGRMVGDFSLLD